MTATAAPSKFPRMHHLPWSPGGTNDDKRMADVAALLGPELVLTEKLDGSNVCLTQDAVFARSHAGPPTHPSFARLKARYAELRRLIQPSCSVFCEYTFAVHSITYRALPSYLWVIAVRDDRSGTWASWPETESAAHALGLPCVPVVVRARYSEAELREATEHHGLARGLFGPREGVVVRVRDRIASYEFASSVAKFVRAGHVTTDDHWAHGTWTCQRIVP